MLACFTHKAGDAAVADSGGAALTTTGPGGPDRGYINPYHSGRGLP